MSWCNLHIAYQRQALAEREGKADNPSRFRPVIPAFHTKAGHVLSIQAGRDHNSVPKCPDAIWYAAVEVRLVDRPAYPPYNEALRRYWRIWDCMTSVAGATRLMQSCAELEFGYPVHFDRAPAEEVDALIERLGGPCPTLQREFFL
jgi:hypothetical protein